MIKLRKANQRGYTELNWLKSWHTFSFDSYLNPDYDHFSSLRVINEDFVSPGGGFATHQHRDMEILTFVLEGALEHKDSLGTGSVIKPGELQRMSAGTGIFHSEYNHHNDKPVHLLQIWIFPNRRGIAPSYEQKHFDIKFGAGLKLIASEQGLENSLLIHQDVNVYTAKLAAEESLIHQTNEKRVLWLQVAKGNLLANNNQMAAGDGAAIVDASLLEITSSELSHILLFDLAAQQV